MTQEDPTNAVAQVAAFGVGVHAAHINDPGRDHIPAIRLRGRSDWRQLGDADRRLWLQRMVSSPGCLPARIGLANLVGGHVSLRRQMHPD